MLSCQYNTIILDIFDFKSHFTIYEISVYEIRSKGHKNNLRQRKIYEFPNQKEQQRHQSPHDKTLPLLLQQQQVKGNGYAAKSISKQILNSPSWMIGIISMAFCQM